MELLIGHLNLDVLILIVDEREDWRLDRGLPQVSGVVLDELSLQVMGGEVEVRIEPVLNFLHTQDVGAVLVLRLSSAHLYNRVLLLRGSDGVDCVQILEEILDHPIVVFRSVAVGKGLEEDTSFGQRLVGVDRLDVVVDDQVHPVDDLLWHHHWSLLCVVNSLHSHCITLEGNGLESACSRKNSLQECYVEDTLSQHPFAARSGLGMDLLSYIKYYFYICIFVYFCNSISIFLYFFLIYFYIFLGHRLRKETMIVTMIIMMMRIRMMTMMIYTL